MLKQSLSFILVLISINCFGQTFEWAKRYYGSYFDQGESVSLDKYGNSYITGVVDGGPLVGNIFVAKYDSQGNNIWSTEFASVKDERAKSIIVDKDNNSYITGYFYEKLIVGNDTLLTDDYSADIFIIKLNYNGNPVWAKSLNGLEYDVGLSITIDDSSNIYVSGRFECDLRLDTFQVTSIGNVDIFLAKLDNQGNAKWLKRFGGNNYEIVNSLKYHNNKLYMTGLIGGSAYFDSITLYNTNGDDVFISVFNINGNTLWAKNSFGNYWLDHGWGDDITIDNSGNVLIVGYFSGTLLFGNDSVTTIAAGDNFVVKYDSIGNCLWAKNIGGSDCNGIDIDYDENIFITGSYGGNAVFDSITISNWGGTDIFIAKFDSSMNTIWVVHGGSHSTDYPTDLIIDDLNNVYVTGSYGGYIGNAVFGTHPFNCNNSNNAFIVKVNDTLISKINEYSLKLFNLNSYPNPTTGKINIELGDTYKEVKVTVRNTMGQTVLSKSYKTTNLLSFEIKDSIGVYFVEIKVAEGKIAILKVIKE